MKEIVSKQLHLLNTYPELIYKGDNALNGYVVYQTGENNELHVYNPNECFLNAYNEYKEEAKSVYYKYKDGIFPFYQQETYRVVVLNIISG